MVPSGDHATLLTKSVWPARVRIGSPVAASHRTTECPDPETSVAPSDNHATLSTLPVSPSRVRIGSPVAASHRMMVPYQDPEASVAPSGDHATLYTSSSIALPHTCPDRSARHR